MIWANLLSTLCSNLKAYFSGKTDSLNKEFDGQRRHEEIRNFVTKLTFPKIAKMMAAKTAGLDSGIHPEELRQRRLRVSSLLQ